MRSTPNRKKKKLSNALLLHLDQICTLRGCSLVELFRNELNIDEGGTVDFDELTVFFGKIGVHINEDLVREVFLVWDSKESRSIYVAEARPESGKSESGLRVVAMFSTNTSPTTIKPMTTSTVAKR